MEQIYLCFYILLVLNNYLFQNHKPEIKQGYSQEISYENIYNYNNGVLSGDGFILTKEDYDDYYMFYTTLYGQEIPNHGLAFIKPDNSLWTIESNSRMIPKKITNNVVSVKTNFYNYLKFIIILKEDGSVWQYNSLEETKLMESIKSIEYGKEGIYVIRDDNSLWKLSCNNSPIINDYNNYNIEKIADDVLNIKIPHYQLGEYVGEDKVNKYGLIIKTDNSLWMFYEENFSTLKEVNKNIIRADIKDNKMIFIENNNNLYYFNCDTMQNKEDFIFISDNVKDAKFRSSLSIKESFDKYIYNKYNGFFELNIIKIDNSLWRYLPHGSNKKNYIYTNGEKIGENMKYILGDDAGAILFMDNKGKTFRIIDNNLKLLDYDIKIPEIS